MCTAVAAGRQFLLQALPPFPASIPSLSQFTSLANGLPKSSLINFYTLDLLSAPVCRLVRLARLVAMPCFRGVDISIIAQPSSKKLPEFPHSDASSVRILPPVGHLSNLTDTGSVSPGANSPHIQKASPRVSVYVPSVPGRSLIDLFLDRGFLTPVVGAQFEIHYSLSKIPEPPCYLYFKIFMNGRNVTNCGVNPAAQASGSITRSLCEPSDRWHYKENGVVLKREGIEARCFYFLPTSSRTSVADDGGIIEVQIFRAKGRKRRSPILGKHRNQDTYGIAFVSIWPFSESEN